MMEIPVFLVAMSLSMTTQYSTGCG